MYDSLFVQFYFSLFKNASVVRLEQVEADKAAIEARAVAAEQRLAQAEAKAVEREAEIGAANAAAAEASKWAAAAAAERLAEVEAEVKKVCSCSLDKIEKFNVLSRSFLDNLAFRGFGRESYKKAHAELLPLLTSNVASHQLD